MRAMIRLRRFLERATKHPVLGPVALLLLALVLALVLVHAAADQALEADTVVVCLALTALVVVVLIPRRPIVQTPALAVPARAPPSSARQAALPPPVFAGAVSPLRL
jgi:hypothetical protein